ncbi:restriction endonuclease subunit S [Idiomarina sp.]|uniref:restriction endonuclease subunit S n=1 Tax=Idiomarina sp. TaxID=1874361 RepID=UPI0025B9643A|nr:restriction endonuclease subunit S [Idiomarina sp.]NQZ03015.1 restriction endonuclease subunit S [Idiomarina sp.]
MQLSVYSDLCDSNVPWLQKIPSHWNKKRLKFVVKLINQKQPVGESGLSYIGLEHIESWTGKKVDGEISQSEGLASAYASGDILFGKLRPYLAKVHLADTPGLVSSEALVIRPSRFISSSYLKYYLLSRDFINTVDSSTYGSKMPRASWDYIGNLPLLIPSSQEQQAIVNFLDHKTAQIDALIAKKQSLLDKLAEQRTALISQAVTKGLDPSVPMNDSGVDWLGEIPGHWQRVLLVRLIMRFEQGWSPSCEAREASKDEWGVLKSGCVNHGIFDERQHKTLPASLTPIESLEVKPGNILMCRASGSKHLIGSVARVRSCRPNLIFSDKTYRISLNENLIDPDFFVFAMKSKYIREQIELSISGADGLANNIPQASVKSYQFVLPEIDEQRAIVKVLTEKSDRISLQEEKTKAVIERLQEYRSALITNAVTGKIDVRDFCILTTTEQREVAHG